MGYNSKKEFNPQSLDTPRKKTHSENIISKSEEKYKTNHKEIKSTFNKKSQELKTIYNCYKLRDCDLPKTDPRAYDLAVGLKLKQKLYEIYNNMTEPDYDNENISRIAREYLSIADGHVKEAALVLMGTQPPSRENLESLIKDVFNFHDSTLINMAFSEIEKYKDAADRIYIEEAILENLSKGSILVREALSKNISQIITSENKNKFLRLIEGLPKDSIIYRNIMNSFSHLQE
jgi:hypothetical protein